jgi:outer membrane protein TolC
LHWTHETDLKVLKLLKAMASLLLCIVHFIGALPTSGSGTAFAQELRPPLTLTSTPPGKMSFAEAINVSIANYPAVAAAIASEDAAAAHITLAKTAYLPRFDLVVQENRSSFNDAFNVYLPSLIDLPIVNGPLQRRRSFDSVWSATSGSVLEWELIDFGLRRARVKLSRTQTDAAKAVTGLTKLDVSVAAANAFFALVATQQRVRAEKANVERMQVFCTTVDALVAAELRAGVDSSMALAELAQARDRLIRAEQAADVARANLAERLGLAGTSVYIVDGPFLLIPEAPKAITLPPFELHPLAIARAADVRVVESRLFVLKKSWFPHIYGQSVMQARGGGDNLPAGDSQLVVRTDSHFQNDGLLQNPRLRKNRTRQRARRPGTLRADNAGSQRTGRPCQSSD